MKQIYLFDKSRSQSTVLLLEHTVALCLVQTGMYMEITVLRSLFLARSEPARHMLYTRSFKGLREVLSKLTKVPSRLSVHWYEDIRFQRLQQPGSSYESRTRWPNSSRLSGLCSWLSYMASISVSFSKPRANDAVFLSAANPMSYSALLGIAWGL